MKILSWILLADLVLLASSAPSTSSGSQPEKAAQGTADGSPQFLYMQLLHDTLKDSNKYKAENKANGEGALLATSIEADSVTGPGNVEDGFEFRPGNTFQLLFTIPRQKEATTIKNAELWLFPSLQYQQSFPEDTIVEMKLIVKVNLAHAKQPRESPMKMTWDTRVDCIPLKMTVLSKKISNNLRKNNLEEANITVTIEVLQTVSQRPFPTDHVNMTSSNIDICDGLAERRTNTPFLVVKYYSDEVYNAYMSSGYSLGMQPVPDSKTKRDLLPVLRDSAGHSNCSIVPLVADLTEIYGSFIIKPRRLDISDCHGSCNSLSNSNSFTQHATIVDKLKLKKGGDFIRDICCVPVAYKSQRLLIFQSHYFVLVEFKDMIVTECACH